MSMAMDFLNMREGQKPGFLALYLTSAFAGVMTTTAVEAFSLITETEEQPDEYDLRQATRLLVMLGYKPCGRGTFARDEIWPADKRLALLRERNLLKSFKTS